jgi:Fe-S oxidoreductase
MCNNNGHCRKFDAGTMCPSYRVTRDEQHLTRGRANTLRLALSGQLGPDGIASPAVKDALDLCVSCKGCKRDCPTGVDMAKMKVEFLHHWHAKHGRSLKDRLIAGLPDYARTAARFAPLLNLRNKVPLLATLGEKMLGFSARRSLPEWQSDHFFARQHGTATREETLAAERPVVLFVDTFNGFFESANAQAALQVLRAAGYTVHLAAKAKADGKHLCCGRTYLATGQVDEAKAKAREVHLSLGLGKPAEQIAANALLLEEFLARELAAGRLDGLKAKLRPVDQPILVHGHCHQKAFDAVSPVLKLLALIPGAKPELVESSCCGMAGAFGYEASHHDVSMQMAELSLLPAVRKSPDAIVVADGTSCRHQIHDGAGREAVHAVALLARQL